MGDKTLIEDRYLGDGVYASLDQDGRIWLDLRAQDTTICLEPEVFGALCSFSADAVKAAERRAREKAT